MLPVGERIRTGAMELCDAFLLQGGSVVRPYHIDVIDYALKTGKKLLGVCLGCQCIQGYFAVKAEAEKRGWTGPLSELFAALRREGNFSFLADVEGHRPSETLPYGSKDAVKHPVHLTEGSEIAKIFGRTEILGATFHIYQIVHPAPGLAVTGRADDGVVEAVEYGDRVVGVQFHPDVDGELHEIFDWLAK